MVVFSTGKEQEPSKDESDYFHYPVEEMGLFLPYLLATTCLYQLASWDY
jgi:hypothetical protein